MSLKWQIVIGIILILLFGWFLGTDAAKDMGALPAVVSLWP